MNSDVIARNAAPGPLASPRSASYQLFRPRRYALCCTVGTVLLLLLTACGTTSRQATDPTTTTRVGTPATAPIRADAGTTDLGAEVVDFVAPATGAELATGNLLAGEMKVTQDRTVDGCMQADGFDMPATGSLQAAADSLVDNFDFPDLDRIAKTGLLLPLGSESLQAAPTFPPSQQQAFQAALGTCEDRARTQFAEGRAQMSDLQRLWIAIATQVAESAPVRRALGSFTSCVEAAGVPASSSGDFDHFLAWVSGQAIQAGAADPVGISTDRRWAPVFVRCATSTVRVEDGLRMQRKAEFVQAHSAELSAVETLMDTELRAAAAQGAAS